MRRNCLIDLQAEGLPQFLELRDRFGNPLYFSHAGDVLLGPSPLIPDGRQRLAEVKLLELRNDDVIIAGFMKAGESGADGVLTCQLLKA